MKPHLLFFIWIVPIHSKSSFKSFSETTAPISSQQPKYKLSSIFSESAIIDQETGQVFWQTGSPRLSDTVSLTGLESETSTFSYSNLRHVKPAVLSLILWFSSLVKVKDYLIENPLLSLSKLRQNHNQVIFHVINTFLFIVGKIILRGNPFAPWFVWTCLFLYVIEAYTCSTRKYLANALSSSEDLENYIESLRKSKPNVIWKVRCFHYQGEEDDEHDKQISSGVNQNIPKKKPLTMPRIPKKVITHTATKVYEFDDWNDQTMVSVWKRASLISSTAAPYSKISFSKLLVLGNAKARDDYLQQQKDFVRNEAYKDDYTEFFTDIQVDGFKPKMLAHRTHDNPLYSSFLSKTADHLKKNKNKIFKQIKIYQFWMYTFLGLTVPFRTWLDHHCDTLCVTLVKETFSLKGKKKKKTDKKESYWGSILPTIKGSILKEESEGENSFLSKMRQLELYGRKEYIPQKISTDFDDNKRVQVLDLQKHDNDKNTKLTIESNTNSKLIISHFILYL